MAESTLALTLEALEAHVGFLLGWGRGANYDDVAWTDREQLGITQAIETGLRWFYFPSVLPGDRESYSWSFMRPTRTVTLVSGESTVALPDDFAGLEGDVHFVESGRMGRCLRQVSEQIIAQAFADQPDRTGLPDMCAIQQPNTTSKTRGTRAQLYVYPTADADYTLSFQYYFQPDTLSTSFPYAHGGAQHAETIKAACVAAADLYQNDRKGQMWDMFIDRMKASTSLDRNNKAQYFGQNLDRGMYNRLGYRDPRFQDFPVVTWDGVTPT